MGGCVWSTGPLADEVWPAGTQIFGWVPASVQTVGLMAELWSAGPLVDVELEVWPAGPQSGWWFPASVP